MAISAIKSDYKSVQLWSGSNNTQYSPEIPSLKNYRTILIIYNVGKTIIWIPFDIFKKVVNVKATSDGENFITVEYVSDTKINIQTTQGSLLTVYGVNI